MSDPPEDILERAAHGEPAAVDELLNRYLPGLRAFIRLRAGATLRAKESTSDIAQSVCREILTHLDRFQHGGEAGFKHWLYTTALRKIGKRSRFYAAEKRDAGREARPSPSSSDADAALIDCYQTFCTPSRVAMGRERIARIEAAFDALPEHYREVIVLSRIVGLSRAEIAAELKTTDLAIRGLLSRALSRLSELADDGNGSSA